MKQAKLNSTGNMCEFMAVKYHQFSMLSDISRGKSALFGKSDCFLCISPHEIAL